MPSLGVPPQDCRPGLIGNGCSDVWSHAGHIVINTGCNSENRRTVETQRLVDIHRHDLLVFCAHAFSPHIRMPVQSQITRCIVNSIRSRSDPLVHRPIKNRGTIPQSLYQSLLNTTEGLAFNVPSPHPSQVNKIQPHICPGCPSLPRNLRSALEGRVSVSIQ